MGRRHLIQCWQGSKEDRHKMILPVVSSLLLASMAFGAPGANYGAAAQVSPAKQISSPSIQCRTEYVTLWDTEYQEREEQVCETVYEKQCETRTQRLCQDVPRQQCHSEHKRFPVRISRQAPKKVCDEVHNTAPLAAAAVHQAPVHHQASPSVQDLLNYGVPAVPTQTVPQIIDARDKQKLQSAAKDDRIVFA